MITIFDLKLIFRRQSQTCIHLLWNILSKVINGFFGNELKRKWSEKDNEYVAGWKTIISATAIIMWRLIRTKRDNVNIYILPKWSPILGIENYKGDVKEPKIQHGWYSGHGGERSSDGFHPGLHLEITEVETRQMAENGRFQWADGFHHWICGEWISSGKHL